MLLPENVEQAAAAIGLIDEGSTVPFIARYRKEATGELDEVQNLQRLEDSVNAKLGALKVSPDQTINADLRIAACYYLLGRYDEARVLLPADVPAGTTIALQRDARRCGPLPRIVEAQYRCRSRSLPEITVDRKSGDEPGRARGRDPGGEQLAHPRG